jgi:hypothetical protein
VERVRVAVSLLAALWVIPSLSAQEKKPWEIDSLCGKLEHIGKTPDRRHANNFSEKRKALRDVNLVLYDRRENESCCNSVNVVERVLTRRGGHFDFESKKAGDFWLVSDWHGKYYKLPVTYKPGKASTTVCSEQGIQFDDKGNADWWVTITVD